MAKPLALTSGEPAGIGPDIAMEAWLRRNELKLPAFYLLGDREFLGNRAAALGLKIRLADGKERSIQSMMATTFWSPDGKPISANQFIEKLLW